MPEDQVNPLTGSPLKDSGSFVAVSRAGYHLCVPFPQRNNLVYLIVFQSREEALNTLSVLGLSLDNYSIEDGPSLKVLRHCYLNCVGAAYGFVAVSAGVSYVAELREWWQFSSEVCST